jgi:signal peptidase II
MSGGTKVGESRDGAGSMTRPRSMIRLGLIIALIVMILDQASKWWMLEGVGMLANPRVIEVTSYFNLVMAWNRGVSFSLFWHEAEYMPYVLSAVALGIVAFLLSWLRKADRPFLAVSIGMVIGGALGNVVDRLRFGAVTDFLDFHVLGYHWPAFNVADTGISVGVALIVLDSLFGGHGTDRETNRTAKGK